MIPEVYRLLWKIPSCGSKADLRCPRASHSGELFDQTIVSETVQTVVLSARVEGKAPWRERGREYVCVCMCVKDREGGKEGERACAHVQARGASVQMLGVHAAPKPETPFAD